MTDLISSVAAVIEIAQLTYAGGKWVREQLQEWKTPVSIRGRNEKFKFGVEYFALSPDIGGWRRFKLGRGTFVEDKRLIQNRAKLLDMYPGLAGQLLVDERISQMPYQVLCWDTDQVTISVRDTQFAIRSTLRDIRDAVCQDLVRHFRRTGITYEPFILARGCDWVSMPVPCMSVEQVSYTDVAATNLIVDLDLRKAFGRAPLRENRLGAASTIREYDFALSEVPGSLPSLSTSSLANPIGVAGIAITADSKILLTHRPRNVSTYADRLGPSASGYVMWHDILSATDGHLKTALLTSLAREISEELHLDLSCDVSVFQPLGIFREMYRAGMPQAFYAFRVNLTSRELTQRVYDARDFRECSGLLFIPINRRVLTGVIATLVRTERVGKRALGMEVQALLTAFAREGETLVPT